MNLLLQGVMVGKQLLHNYYYNKYINFVIFYLYANLRMYIIAALCVHYSFMIGYTCAYNLSMHMYNLKTKPLDSLIMHTEDDECVCDPLV